MAGVKDIEKTETVAAPVKTDPGMEFAEQDLASDKDRISSNTSFSIDSSGDATSSIKGKNDNKSVGEHGVCYPPTSCYNSYYYPGYGGNFTQMDGYYQADGSYTGMQSDDGSLVYYLPGYNPYGSGTFAGVDEQTVGQQPYLSSSGYIQHPVSYGSEAVPYYSWDSAFLRDVQNGNSATLGIAKSGPGSNASVKSNGVNSMKTNGNVSKFSKPIPHTHPLKPLNKVPHSVSDYSSGFLKGVHPAFHYQKHGSFPHNGSLNYRQNGRTWTGNDRFKQRDRSSRNIESSEITRGPRANNSSAPSDSPAVKDLVLPVSRDQYNLPDFEIEYENAKFYVIKSFSEDNVHKCIKYDVWSSTANGNRKLDAAFHDAEAIASEKGTKCPVFLFFSVNGSGQFVGCAEMMGKVDFNKDMDFWHLDKWNGFFPVKWHMIKDIPNSQLRHIILENNDNKDVTYTRDTQEIGLKQGLEMLKIFKNYSPKTSLLDDFNFYELREKSSHSRRSTKPATQRSEVQKDADLPKNADAASLVNLAKNLSLNDAGEEKSDALKIPVDNQVPSAAAAAAAP